MQWIGMFAPCTSSHDAVGLIDYCTFSKIGIENGLAGIQYLPSMFES